MTGRCPAYGEGITYWPLREVIMQVTHDRSVDELAARLGIPPCRGASGGRSVGLAEPEAGEETRWASSG